MINERRSNPVVSQKLGTLIGQKAWSELDAYLLSLSNADFRSAGHILCEDIMLRFSGNDFWEIFSHLSLFHPKAFLGTCLKAAVTQYRAGKISISEPCLIEYAETVCKNNMSIDRDKFLTAMAEVLQSHDEFNALFNMFNVSQGIERLRYLLRCTTVAAYYSLFENLKHVQDNEQLLQKCCYALIKKGDRLSYNLSSIICKYFDLKNIRGTFSLKIEPYQLNYLDSSQEAFAKVLTSV